MAEDTIVFPDLKLVEQLEELLSLLALPPTAEFRVEPALDYPGQQVAIDLAALDGGQLSAAVEIIRDAIFHQFRIAVRTASEIDREILARQPA